MCFNICFLFWMMENTDLHSREMAFTGVSISSSYLKYEFRENTFLLNFQRKRNCLLCCPHGDPHTLSKNIFFRSNMFKCYKILLLLNFSHLWMKKNSCMLQKTKNSYIIWNYDIKINLYFNWHISCIIHIKSEIKF